MSQPTTTTTRRERADVTTPIRGKNPEADLPADLGRGLPDTPFTRGAARRPAPQVADPLLQWATGLTTRDRQIYAGWLVEAGKLEALDEALGDAGYKQVTIKHGSGNLVTHWAIEVAALGLMANAA